MNPKTDELFVGLVRQRRKFNILKTNRRLLVLDLKKATLIFYDQSCLKSTKSNSDSFNDNASFSTAAADKLFEGELKNGSPQFMKASAIGDLHSPKLYLPPETQWEFQDVKDDDLHFRIIINNPGAMSTMIDSESDDHQESSGLLMNDSLSELEKIDENYGSVGKSSGTNEKQDETSSSNKILIRCKSRQVKGLWLQAATYIDRCKGKEKRSKKFFSLVSKGVRLAQRERKIVQTNNITKRSMSRIFKSETKVSIEDCYKEFHREELSSLAKGEGKHFKVLPDHKYKHDFMTHDELVEEMLLPSDSFVDLRSTESTDMKPIGSIRVEVLNCTNLPKLDTLSKTDAVCYLVCGSHAFCTDVIDDTLNPMWPKKSKRACIFPIFHAFAQLFVGVFDDDGEYETDDFAGRVVIDISRLRPKTLYDVTIPLRDSAFTYSKKSRGAIRLRFTLEFDNEKAAIMSYIPSKKQIKEFLKCQSTTTVKCADKKAFRNVAYTVHGKSLPGRFSSSIQRSVLREFKMLRLIGLYTSKKVVVETVTWEDPFISFFVFAGWMYSVQKNSMAMVPPYIFGVILLFMMRGYSEVINSMNHWGFNPLYLEELFNSLIFGTCFGPRFMKPLDIKPGDDISVGGQMNSRKHTPLLTRFFTLIGFLPELEHIGKLRMNTDHMEFPFSNGEQYPKMLLKDLTSSEYSPDEDEFDDDKSLTDGNQQGESNSSISEIAPLNEEEKETNEFTEALRKRIPLQDVSCFVKSAIPLDYDLILVKDKILTRMFYCIDDRVCYVKDDDNTRRKQLEYMLETELGIHDYPSIVTRKMSEFISPVLGVMKLFLGFCRSVTNIFLWKDPYLSFWFCLFLLSMIALLLVFPWRMFLGMIGILGFGPQNFFMKDKVQKKVLALKAKPEFKPWKKKLKSKEKQSYFRAFNSETTGENEFIFRNHLASDDENSAELEVREVVVPYSRLRYNRFYDWPPDPNMSKAAECPPGIH